MFLVRRGHASLCRGSGMGIEALQHHERRQISFVLPLLYRPCSLFLGRERPSFFWSFLREWDKAAAELPEAPTDAECAEAILGTGSSVSGADLASLLHLSLSMRSLSPAAVVLRQLARDSLEPLLSNGSFSGTASSPKALGDVRSAAGELPDSPGLPCSWAEVSQGRLLQTPAEVEGLLASLDPG